jgi:hypothetical protein
VTDFLSSLDHRRADAAAGTLADAIGTSRPKLARLLTDNSPLFANLDGRGPLLSQEKQARGLPTWYVAHRKVRGNMGGWAPTWTLTLVCDGTSHELLVPARLISPAAWVAHAVLVWRAGDEGACWRTVDELAAEFGVSSREAQRLTRELRAAGLLLVRDRRGTSRKGEGRAAKASVYMPVVDRRSRLAGAERPVVELLRQLPMEVPARQAWALDRLDPTGIISEKPGLVGFGGWAAWRALSVADGPVPLLPQVLADQYGIAPDVAAGWAEQAAVAGLASVDLTGVWTPVLVEEPRSAEEMPSAVYIQVSRHGAPSLIPEEGAPEAVDMASGLLHLVGSDMTSGLLQHMASGLLQHMASGLWHETETLSSDPVQGVGLRSVVEVQEVSGEVVLAPPKAHVVDAAAARPSAGAAKIKPSPVDHTADRVLVDHSVQALLVARMTPGQLGVARQLIAAALASEDRPTAEQLGQRLAKSLTGKSTTEIDDPFAWFRKALKRPGCRENCTCRDPACEGGTLWPGGYICGHCAREGEDRLLEWRAEQRQAVAQPLPEQRAMPQVLPMRNCDACDRGYRSARPGLCGMCITAGS